jgi:integrase
MAVMKRGKVYTLAIRPFGPKAIWVKTTARSKAEVKQVEVELLKACKTGDYKSLDRTTREACVRMFQNQCWEIPPDLLAETRVKDELTLWKGIELFLTAPQIKSNPNLERYQQSFVHVVEKLGKDVPVKSIWIPAIRQYQMERLSDGATASTINKEKSALSRMFQVLIEARFIDDNPARFVKNLSEKSGEREVYVSFHDFQRILEALPAWVRPIAQTAYYTGMRRAEILGLTPGRVDLSRRMILLGPEDVKEGKWKRVPIHPDLVPILEEVMKVRSIHTDKIFLVEGRPPCRTSIRKPWVAAVEEVGLDPGPRFHDLRHTWKANARRAKMDPELRERILGHWSRTKTVTERYGGISEAELLEAIDSMTFDNGDTLIVVAGGEKKKPGKDSTPDRGKMLARR